MSTAYTRLCDAIEAMHASDIESLPLAAALRIAGNTEPENMATAVRLRAERALSILMRDAAGRPPKNKRDAAWLAQFDRESQP